MKTEPIRISRYLFTRKPRVNLYESLIANYRGANRTARWLLKYDNDVKDIVGRGLLDRFSNMVYGSLVLLGNQKNFKKLDLEEHLFLNNAIAEFLFDGVSPLDWSEAEHRARHVPKEYHGYAGLALSANLHSCLVRLQNGRFATRANDVLEGFRLENLYHT